MRRVGGLVYLCVSPWWHRVTEVEMDEDEKTKIASAFLRCKWTATPEDIVILPGTSRLPQAQTDGYPRRVLGEVVTFKMSADSEERGQTATR